LKGASVTCATRSQARALLVARRIAIEDGKSFVKRM
jgi:hypothetical protein